MAAQPPAGELHLTARRLVPRSTGHNGWVVEERPVTWRGAETALVIVDMWDRHWSRGASERVAVLAPRIDALARAARQAGATVVHAASEVMGAYADHPARRNALAAPHRPLPEPAERPDPPLPIDDSDGGSDTGEASWWKAWSRQHPAIAIEPADVLSDDVQEIHSALAERAVRRLIYAGVHLNMCVLHRPFGIKRMVRLGYDAVLVRDATDTMYNPYRPPYVAHDVGTELVVRYVEQFWCPTILSGDLTLVR
jgi:nicotinamidase-related amidase